VSSEATKVIRDLRSGLVACERGLAECDATDEALLAMCDHAEKQRMGETERQREMLRTETDPHKVRGIEQAYLDSSVMRARAARLARSVRGRIADRKRLEARRGEPLIRNRRKRGI